MNPNALPLQKLLSVRCIGIIDFVLFRNQKSKMLLQHLPFADAKPFAVAFACAETIHSLEKNPTRGQYKHKRNDDTLPLYSHHVFSKN